MFEHESLNGERYRLVAAKESFIKAEVLEERDGDVNKAPRRQYAVAGNVLVERYLPQESIGDAWSHDSVATPWWMVVDHPPHAGIVADYNSALGGIYKRKLDPENNVVAYAENGEEVVMKAGVYSLVRSTDNQEMSQLSLVDLRRDYYA